ncbi:MAG: phosphoribosylformylglycinamidine synthase subunit PurQ [Parcubacteria group bacterium]|jgi:phosphoribosylformylglycinamidine synthase
MKKAKGKKKKVFIPYFPGTNCEVETMVAFENAGARPELLFLADLQKEKKKITDCDLICFPGGFSYGDYVDTGIIAATLMQDFMSQLVEAKIPALAICNGFQGVMRAGVFGKGVTLTTNDSGTFCSRPTDHLVVDSNCVWTKGLTGKVLPFPSAHGGGKVFRTKSPNIVLKYVSKSPNGGIIAGICSDNGLIFGLMDHPERALEDEEVQEIFRNGIRAA